MIFLPCYGHTLHHSLPLSPPVEVGPVQLVVPTCFRTATYVASRELGCKSYVVPLHYLRPEED